MRSRAVHAVAVVALLFSGCTKEEVPIEPEETVIGTVGEVDVKQGLFDAYLMYTVQLPDEPHSGDDDGRTEYSDEVRSRLLDRFLMERALVERARAAGIVVTPEDVDQFARRTGLGSVEAFEQGMPLTQREYLTQYLEDSVLAKRYLETKIYRNSSINEADALRYYRDNINDFSTPQMMRLRRIRVETVRASKNLRSKVGKSRDRFLAAAEELSAEDSEHGSDLGLWPIDKLPEQFAEGVRELQVGDISGIVRDPDGGYNLFLIEERVDATTLSFDEVSSGLRTLIERSVKSDRFDRFMADLEASTEIVLHENALNFSYSRDTDPKSAALDQATPEPKEPNGGAS